jgi:hypothetical protein
MKRSWRLERSVPLIVIMAAALVHAAFTYQLGWRTARASSPAFDYASFHYATAAAFDGADPYDTRELSRRARQERTRPYVFPYLYPPPFLLLMSWTRSIPLFDAYLRWFWIQEFFALGTLLVMTWWWRPWSRWAPVILCCLFALAYTVPGNLYMGQVNHATLFFAMAGLAFVARGRSVAGGALMGTACVLKLSPALFILWWALQRRWTAIGAAAGAALVWIALSALILGPGPLRTFFGDTLPGLLNGSYNDLPVPIQSFGNYSIPAFWARLLSPEERDLTAAAQWATRLSAIGILLLSGWRLRSVAPDSLGSAAQASAVMVALLLLPAYTWEHHLVWIIPAAVVPVAASIEGRLSRAWWLALVPAGAVLCFPMFALQSTAHGLSTLPRFALAELTLAAMLVIWSANLKLTRGPAANG